jgi:hypothetical protein
LYGYKNATFVHTHLQPVYRGERNISGARYVKIYLAHNSEDEMPLQAKNSIGNYPKNSITPIVYNDYYIKQQHNYP